VTSQKSLLQNRYLKIAVTLGLIAAIVLGFYFTLTIALGNVVPVRVVTDGSMCTAQGGCNGWSHNFVPTLHVGDLVFIQTLNPQEYNANYPYSDIIVYPNPDSHSNPNFDTIISRIVSKYQDSSGVWRFQTKGDGKGALWPAEPSAPEYDSHTPGLTGEGVPQDLVYGRVAMRIPYVGLVAIFVQKNSWVLPAVAVLALLAAVFAFSFPKLRLQLRKQPLEQQNSKRK